MKTIMIALLALGLTNCAQTNYKVKQEAKEEGRVLNQVPQWYVDAKIDKGFIFNKDADKFVYAVGQGASPDLQLAIEKATIVNVVKGTMIQGYEAWEKEVYETPSGEYRVYVGLKMGVGDSNKLAEYIAKHAFSAVDVDTLAKNAIDKVIITNPDGIPTVE